MNFLDESSSTLQEALSFIDACEASSSDSHGGSSAEAAKIRAGPKVGYW